MFDDQDFLLSRINDIAEVPLTLPRLKGLNRTFGYGPTLSAMRTLWGFPPPELRDPFRYIWVVLTDEG